MSSCFVCKKTGNLKNLTDDKMQKCRKMLAFRKKKFFKYGDIELPVGLYQKGYHIDCYNRFIVLKRRNKEEFDAMFISTTFDGQDPIITTTPMLNDESSEDEPSNDVNQNSTEPFETRTIKKETEEPKDNSDIEIETHDIEEEIAEETTPLSVLRNDEASYLTPDISRAVILKSILTRKAPIKRDMTRDQFSFNYGMSLFKPSFNHQSNLNPPDKEIEPKIINSVSLAETGVCIFCEKKERQIGTQKEFPTVSKEELFEGCIKNAEDLDENELIEKLKDKKTLFFHPICRTEHRNNCEKLTKKNCDEQDLMVFRNLHAEAFEAICAFIDDKIINQNQTYLLSDLYERYKAVLHEIQDSSKPFDFEGYSSQNLQEKILNRYYGTIQITTSKSMKRKIVSKSVIKTISYNPPVQNEDTKYERVAFEIRSAIKSMKRNSGDTNDDIPEKLTRFIGYLIQGPDIRKKNSKEDCAKIKSVCKNIVDQIIGE